MKPHTEAARFNTSGDEQGTYLAPLGSGSQVVEAIQNMPGLIPLRIF